MKHTSYFKPILLIGLLLILSSLLIRPLLNQAATSSCAVATEIPQVQRNTLLTLYNSTDGANWKNKTGWNETNTSRSWFGITCSGGNVTAINLTYNNLKGSLPDLSALTGLQYLDLTGNQLTGTILELSKLSSLKGLGLAKNKLTGTIPELTKLTSLLSLSLNNNQLTGSIPSLSKLTNLQQVFLHENQLCKDPNANYERLEGVNNFPTCCTAVTEISKAQCDTLVALYNSTGGANWKKKTGWNETNTPSSWFGITCSAGNVISIRLAKNNLRGSLPNLSALTSLQRLELDFNQLTGSIPNLSVLTSLQVLSLEYNQLTGTIPELSKLTSLQRLNLNHNQLTGTIPEFSKLTSLQSFWLSDNQLTGSLPELSGLTTLIYSNNPKLCRDANYRMQGRINDIPSCTTTDCTAVAEIPQAQCDTLLALYNSTGGANWKEKTGWNETNTPCSWFGITCGDGNVARLERGKITHIEISMNNLKGSLPDLSMLTSLEFLGLGGNQLTGSLPELSKLTSLQSLRLSNNHLTGSLPELSKLTSLQRLELNHNQLTGSIPELNKLTSLQRLELNGNHLTGSIPELSKLTSLQSLRLSDNQLTGSIPELSELTSLQGLYLDNNRLTGSIPELSELTSLQSLRLSSNQLTGSIPELSKLTSLQGLELNHNQLTGSVPDLSKLNLDILSLSHNQLTGNVPEDWNMNQKFLDCVCRTKKSREICGHSLKGTKYDCRIVEECVKNDCKLRNVWGKSANDGIPRR